MSNPEENFSLKKNRKDFSNNLQNLFVSLISLPNTIEPYNQFSISLLTYNFPLNIFSFHTRLPFKIKLLFQFFSNCISSDQENFSHFTGKITSCIQTIKIFFLTCRMWRKNAIKWWELINQMKMNCKMHSSMPFK